MVKALKGNRPQNPFSRIAHYPSDILYSRVLSSGLTRARTTTSSKSTFIEFLRVHASRYGARRSGTGRRSSSSQHGMLGRSRSSGSQTGRILYLLVLYSKELSRMCTHIQEEEMPEEFLPGQRRLSVEKLSRGEVAFLSW